MLDALIYPAQHCSMEGPFRAKCFGCIQSHQPANKSVVTGAASLVRTLRCVAQMNTCNQLDGPCPSQRM